MKPRRPIARRSAKGIERDKEYAAARAERERTSGGWCEGDTPACRRGAHRAQHAHHVKRRSQGGGHTVENLRMLCWDGHDWVHAHPDDARELGLLA